MKLFLVYLRDYEIYLRIKFFILFILKRDRKFEKIIN